MDIVIPIASAVLALLAGFFAGRTSFRREVERRTDEYVASLPAAPTHVLLPAKEPRELTLLDRLHRLGILKRGEKAPDDPTQRMFKRDAPTLRYDVHPKKWECDCGATLHRLIEVTVTGQYSTQSEHEEVLAEFCPADGYGSHRFARLRNHSRLLDKAFTVNHTFGQVLVDLEQKDVVTIEQDLTRMERQAAQQRERLAAARAAAGLYRGSLPAASAEPREAALSDAPDDLTRALPALPDDPT